MQIEKRAIGELQANCYLVNKRVLIDAGDGIGELDRFLDETQSDLRAVILTHGHFDHMLGAAHLQSARHAKIYMSEADAPSLYDERLALCLPYHVTPFQPIRADGLLKEGMFEIEGLSFEVMLTPGHTPGGLCLVNHEDKCIFTGDTLFRFGYGRTDLYGGNESDLFRSLKRLLSMDDDYYIYPGHGEGAYLGEIKRHWR